MLSSSHSGRRHAGTGSYPTARACIFPSNRPYSSNRAEVQPALPIVDDLHQVAARRRDGTRHRDAPVRQGVDPIHFAADQVLTLAQVVSDAQDKSLAAALEFVDETLERIERPDLILCDAI